MAIDRTERLSIEQNTAFLSRKFMITCSSIVLEDLDSSTSFVTLVNTKFAQKNLPVATSINTAPSVTLFKFVNHFSRMNEGVKVNARKLVLLGLVEM